jgi:hypothetical protein
MARTWLQTGIQVPVLYDKLAYNPAIGTSVAAVTGKDKVFIFAPKI